ncbi:MAG TPA: hypothetical protein VGR50_01240 [Terriglobales bacterium]|nr:hypothetical protein [Terriglobales bacterium]
MPVPSYKAVLKRYDASPAHIQKYFEHLPRLIREFDWDVCIAYQFIRLETAQNRALYGGVVKMHRANSEVSSSVLRSLHLTRASFLTHVETIFEKPVPADVANKIKFAEKIRDNTVHGKESLDPDVRQALVDTIEYAIGLDDFVYSVANFRPFGDMRGFRGAGESLEKATTRWLLKGLGLQGG